MTKAIFIDKDGTLVHDVPYNVDPDYIRLQPGASLAIREWKNAGFLVIVISNQSGIARGYFKEHEIQLVIEKLRALLRDGGADIDDFYYCPHFPDGIVAEYSIICNCRKPAPGLIVEAAIKWEIDLSASWMIGDILNDVEAGVRAGCRTVLIDNGNETEWHLTQQRMPTLIVKDLTEAVKNTLSYASIKHA
jgi:D-glycero-D-manno-heptose 1,7-bisphosphate phosphatase